MNKKNTEREEREGVERTHNEGKRLKQL